MDCAKLSSLIHEIGNTLTAATIAHEMMQKGSTESASSNSKVLSQCHARMWELINDMQAQLDIPPYKRLSVSPIPL